jgi:predicted metal-dependent phosphoesterase TrpH
MLVDLHIHTRLSRDSSAEVEHYLEALVRGGNRLGALCLTEHRLFPLDRELDRRYAELSDRHRIRLFKGVEADTDLGHLILLGITPALMRSFDLTDRMLRAEALIAAIDAEGGIAIPAHPFRDSGFGLRLAYLRDRLGGALRAIEAVNGQNTEEQNRTALEAADSEGLIAVAGSDAHFANSGWFPAVATELEREVTTIEELCAELRAGRARPYRFDRSA